MTTRVLVIDDDPDILVLVTLLLSREGFTVMSVDSGSAALDLLTSEDLPDIALLDVRMTHIDGWETLARIRSDERTVRLPVVMCTATGLSEDMSLWWSRGCDGYVGKPFSIASLRDEIETVLARDPQEREALRHARMCDPEVETSDRNWQVSQ